MINCSRVQLSDCLPEAFTHVVAAKTNRTGEHEMSSERSGSALRSSTPDLSPGEDPCNFTSSETKTKVEGGHIASVAVQQVQL